MIYHSCPKTLLWLCLVFFLSSCAGPVKISPPPDPKTLYAKAESLEKSGKNQEASQSYILLWRTYPNNELAPRALYKGANLASASDPARAGELYRSFLSSYPKSPLRPQVVQKLLAEEIRQKRYAEACDLYVEAFPKKPDQKLVQQGVGIAQGLAGTESGGKVLGLTCLIFPHADKSSQEKLLPLWRSAIEKADQVEALEKVEPMAKDKRLREPLIAGKARLAASRDQEEAGDSADSSDEGALSWPSQASQDIKGTVGVLLPLSGKYETIGQKVLKGIELASGVFNPESSSPLSYAIRDYGDNEQAIPGLIEQLDAGERVVAVIGPVGEGAGAIACREAQKRGIPFLVFTRSENAPSQSSLCFSNFVSVDVQADALLKAAAQRGITRFGVLYPTDNFGRTFTATFLRRAPAHGVTVVRQVEYSPNLGDFKSAVQKIFKGTPRAGKAKGPDTSIQGLLIPDGATNAGMIASYFPVLNVKGVRLFGPTLWENPDLARIGGKSVEDALFVSGFYASSQDRNVQAFNEKFSSTFGYRPTLWEANAYDSAAILQGLAASGTPTRQGLKAGIGSLRNYPGLTGVTSFQRNGSVSKDITVLTIRNGTIVEVIP